MAKQRISDTVPKAPQKPELPPPASTLEGLSDQIWHNRQIYSAIHGYADKTSETMRGMVVCPITRKQDGLFEYLAMRLVRKMVPFRYDEGEHSFEVPTSSVLYIQRYVDLHAIEWGESNNTEVFIYNPDTDKHHKYRG
jgi:hypothetical protein